MEALQVKSNLTIPAGELKVTFSRSGGPGGQNVNKVNTKVTLRWNISTSAILSDYVRNLLLNRLSNRLNSEGDLIVTCEETRSQERNLEISLSKLAELIRAATHIAKKRRATKPTAGSRERRIKTKSRRGQIKKMRGRPSAHD